MKDYKCSLCGKIMADLNEVAYHWKDCHHSNVVEREIPSDTLHIQPTTIDTMRSISDPIDRQTARIQYAEWRQKQRQQDRKEQRRIASRISQIKAEKKLSPEVLKERKRNYSKRYNDRLKKRAETDPKFAEKCKTQKNRWYKNSKKYYKKYRLNKKIRMMTDPKYREKILQKQREYDRRRAERRRMERNAKNNIVLDGQNQAQA